MSGSGTVVDARGLRCPVPVIRLAAAARGAPPGTTLTLWASDPAAEFDVPAWARMRGHTVVAQCPLPDGESGLAITVRLGTA